MSLTDTRTVRLGKTCAGGTFGFSIGKFHADLCGIHTSSCIFLQLASFGIIFYFFFFPLSHLFPLFPRSIWKTRARNLAGKQGCCAFAAAWRRAPVSKRQAYQRDGARERHSTGEQEKRKAKREARREKREENHDFTPLPLLALARSSIALYTCRRFIPLPFARILVLLWPSLQCA